MINSLTSFRFFAALLVFFWHIRLFMEYELGHVGVSFFFVLSGFILTYNYHVKFKEINKENIFSFYVARLAKIYPLHFLTFFLSLPVFFVVQSKSVIGNMSEFTSGVIKAISNLLLLQSHVPNSYVNFAFNGVSWSISNEMFFYLLLPFILFLTYKWLNSVNRKQILSITIILWALMFIFFSTINVTNTDQWSVYVFPMVRLFDFLCGISLGFVFLKSDVAKVSFNRSWFTVAEILGLILVIVAILNNDVVNQAQRYSLYYLPLWYFLIYVYSFQKGFISKLLSNKILIVLGEISFSFYMIHQLVIYYCRFIIERYIGTNILLEVCVSLPITLVASYILYFYFEEPLRKRIRNKYRTYTNERKMTLNN